jgi:hypothetical protein
VKLLRQAKRKIDSRTLSLIGNLVGCFRNVIKVSEMERPFRKETALCFNTASRTGNEKSPSYFSIT